MSIPVPKYTLYDRKDIEVLVAYILYKVCLLYTSDAADE